MYRALYAWSGRYRRAHGFLISYQLHRLKGYGRFDALLSIVAHKRLGTKMYWHPPAERERLRAERCNLMASHEH